MQSLGLCVGQGNDEGLSASQGSSTKKRTCAQTVKQKKDGGLNMQTSAHSL